MQAAGALLHVMAVARQAVLLAPPTSSSRAQHGQEGLPVCLSSSTERSLQGPHTLGAGQDHPQLRAFPRTCTCRPLGSSVF